MAEGTRMQQRRDTEAHWVTSNYLLAAGEIGVSTDTNTVKVGNGSTHWVDLPILFETEFLPLHGKADDSSLLNGVDGSNYITQYDADVAATANKIAKRGTGGTLKATTAAASDDLTTLAQLQAAALLLSPRTVTTTATLALTDQNGMVFVNHSSLTTQVQITVPPNSGTGSVAFPIGAKIEVIAIGAGGAKIVPGTGVTISGATNGYPNYGGVRLVKTGTNTWVSIGLNAHKRTPKIRVTNNGTGTYPAGSFYTVIPWAAVDSTVDFYNPDNEWFSIPGTGLSTARRIIVNKDGEYLVTCNFLCSSASIGSLVITKMVADNTLTGGRLLCNVSTHNNNQAMVRVRFAAGESVGAAYQAPAGGATDVADGTSDNRCDFTITRLSD
jgi:hypothetical protein